MSQGLGVTQDVNIDIKNLLGVPTATPTVSVDDTEEEEYEDDDDDEEDEEEEQHEEQV